MRDACEIKIAGVDLVEQSSLGAAPFTVDEDFARLERPRLTCPLVPPFELGRLDLPGEFEIDVAHFGAGARFDDDVPGFACIFFADLESDDGRKIALGFQGRD